MFIDTHAHIYTKEFENDTFEMLERARNNNIAKILMPAIDASSHPKMLLLENENPDLCLSMMGLHPSSVNETVTTELDIIENHLKNKKFIAIGETGLDFYWDLSFKNKQYEAFETQIEWALQYNLPVVIHSRNSTDECIEVIKKYAPRDIKGVFHCFGGTVEQAKTLMSLGFYMGIGGVLTFKKSGLDAVLKQLPLSHIILETDAPYLAPTPCRGKRNEPAYIPLIAQKLADVKEISLEEVAAITTANAQKLFRLP